MISFSPCCYRQAHPPRHFEQSKTNPSSFFHHCSYLPPLHHNTVTPRLWSHCWWNSSSSTRTCFYNRLNQAYVFSFCMKQKRCIHLNQLAAVAACKSDFCSEHYERALVPRSCVIPVKQRVVPEVSSNVEISKPLSDRTHPWTGTSTFRSPHPTPGPSPHLSTHDRHTLLLQIHEK